MIDDAKAWTYFDNKFGLTKSTNGWWAYDCPFCDEVRRNKMSVHFRSENVKCWRCEYAGSISNFVAEIEGMKYMEAQDYINTFEATDVDLSYLEALGTDTEETGIELPNGYVPIMQGSRGFGVRARNYLIQRGFSIEAADHIGIGYCNESSDAFEDDYFGRIIIPFKRMGKLIYFQARDFIGDELRYKNPSKEKTGIGKADMFFNEDALSLYKYAYLTEGWADAFTFKEKGISSQGWHLSEYQVDAIKRSYTKHFILVPDAGVDGQGVPFYKKAMNLAAKFIDLKETIRVANLDALIAANNLDPLKQKDANSIGLKILSPYLKTLQPITFADIIKETAA